MVPRMTGYTVRGHEFAGTLAGLTSAIKLAREFAQEGGLDVLREDGTVAYHVPQMDAPQRGTHKGHHPVRGEEQ